MLKASLSSLTTGKFSIIHICKLDVQLHMSILISVTLIKYYVVELEDHNGIFFPNTYISVSSLQYLRYSQINNRFKAFVSILVRLEIVKPFKIVPAPITHKPVNECMIRGHLSLKPTRIAKITCHIHAAVILQWHWKHFVTPIFGTYVWQNIIIILPDSPATVRNGFYSILLLLFGYHKTAPSMNFNKPVTQQRSCLC